VSNPFEDSVASRPPYQQQQQQHTGAQYPRPPGIFVYLSLTNKCVLRKLEIEKCPTPVPIVSLSPPHSLSLSLSFIIICFFINL
jgi:hypothetical protein